MPLSQAQLTKLQTDAAAAQAALTQLDACVFTTPINPAAIGDNGANVAFKVTALTNDIAGLVADPSPVTPPPTTTPVIGNWNNGAVLPIKTQIVHDYCDAPNNTTYTYSAARTAQQAGKRLMLNVGLLTAVEATSIATMLKANGQLTPLIVYPWEMNNNNPDWVPLWNQFALTAAESIAVEIVIHDAIKAVLPGAQFVWCKAAGDSPNAPGRTAYDTVPPPEYVDYLAEDIYDTFGSVAGAQASIADLASHAAAINIPWGLCEVGSGGTDDAAFWTMVHTESTDGTCTFVCFFAYAGQTSGQGADVTKQAASLAVIDADF